MRVWLEGEPIEKKKKSLWLWVAVVVVAVLAALLVLIFTFQTRRYIVKGESMLPTLHAEDRLTFNTMIKPEYGDIVVFYSDYDLLVKRVIGLPGDVIYVSENGQVTRNGEQLNEPYMIKDLLNNSETAEITVTDGCVFVMGDNRGASVDSRDIRIGLVSESMICGCVTKLSRDVRLGDDT